MDKTTGQHRRFYRLETDRDAPVYVHLDGEMLKAVDVSITGLKLAINQPNPQWEMDKAVDISIQFPGEHAPLANAVARVCYLDASHLGLKFEEITTMDKKRVSDYVLKITKNQGIW